MAGWLRSGVVGEEYRARFWLTRATLVRFDTTPTLSIIMKIIVSAVSLLASLSSCNAEESFLRAAIPTEDAQTPTIIDLSQDIPRDEAAISSSPGSKAVQEAAAEDPLFRNVMVIENGSIVSSYHRDDVDPNETHEVRSVTKSWISLLIGLLMDDGLLSLDTTLGEIFSNDEAWADVTDGSTDFRKSVTVEELLTMTSGLIDNHRLEDTNGGHSLEGALSYPGVVIEVKGKWDYLVNPNILSYIIVELTGMTPRQFSAERVMGKLGVGEDEYDWDKNWDKNFDGVQSAGGGLHLTPMQMAKFGQLYLQGGRTSPSNDERVISEEWIDASFSHYSTTDWSSVGMGGVDRLNGNPYGYLFVGFEYPSRPTVYCAFGDGGQFVCVDRDLGRVVIAQRENKNIGFSDMFNVVDAALGNTLSFRAPNSGLSGISSTVESRAE
eukprot:scaffold1600_cov79-Skeletonema_dohrnii-CCMP3373.AAC.4